MSSVPKTWWQKLEGMEIEINRDKCPKHFCLPHCVCVFTHIYIYTHIYTFIYLFTYVISFTGISLPVYSIIYLPIFLCWMAASNEATVHVCLSTALEWDIGEVGFGGNNIFLYRVFGNTVFKYDWTCYINCICIDFSFGGASLPKGIYIKILFCNHDINSC